MDRAVVRKERYVVWGAMLAGIILVTAVWLSNVTEYGSGNDPNYALGNGYAIDPADPFLHKLHDGAVANCAPDDAWCIGYQQLILSDLHFNYPIYAVFGRLLPLNPGEAFGAAAATATLGAVTTGFVLGLVLFGLVIMTLPTHSRLAIAVIFVVGAPVMLLAREYPFRQPDIGTSMTWLRLAAYVGGLLAASLVVQLPGSRRLADRLLDRLVRLPTTTLLAVAVASLLIIIGCRLVFPASAIVWAAGIVLFVVLIVICSLLARTGFVTGAMIVFVVFLIEGPHYFLGPVVYVAPRGNIYLVASSLITYFALYPNGRLVWLLPVLAIFHVSVCSLIATALFAVEACIFLWRRHVTLLLVVAGVVMIAGRLFTALSFHGFASSVSLWTAARAVVESDRFLPGLLFAVSLGAAGLLLLRRSEGKWDAAARVVLLTALLAICAQVSPILDLAKFTLFDEGLAAILLAPHYLAPAIAIAVVVVLITCLLRTAESDGRAGVVPRLAVLAFTAMAVLEVVRVQGIGVSPGQWASQSATSLTELATARGKLSRDPLFHRLRADDDVYFLRSSLAPMSDPIIYLSLLKYKVRAAAGVFDPQSAVIEIIDGANPDNITPPDP
jgi:hypothetical protein